MKMNHPGFRAVFVGLFASLTLGITPGLAKNLVLEVVTAQDHDARPALMIEEDTLQCALQEGRTAFVIKLANPSLLDRLTFENENAAAAGQLKIFVSNDRLPADSPQWVEVDGAIAFSHKRLFSLSMVGVEARYVKLSFEVEKAGRIASADLSSGEKQERNLQFGWVANNSSTRTPLGEAKSAGAFKIAEIDAFDLPVAMTHTTEAPELYASNFSGIQGGGATSSPEISSNTIGTIAIPPTLAVVSP